jgi:DNA primase
MTILTLLSDLLGSYKSFQTGEHYFTCPFCHNAKKKFAFNEHNLKWHCWHCDAKGGHVIWLLKQLNVSKSDLAKFKDVLTDVDITQYKNTTATSSLLLPPEYKPLWQVDTNFNYLNALSYLKKRGIRAEDVMRYRMGYCESGVYKNRIIIPSYNSSNTLNYFIARSFYNDPMRFMNPPVTKNIICFENMINWNLPIVLCEGVFDAITLRRNAIPLLGKTLPKNLHLALIEKKVQEERKSWG